MGNRYLDSGATPTAPYESEATAANALATLASLDLAVDEVIWVKDTHDEGANASYASPASATPGSPQRVLGVTDFDSAPSSLAMSATARIRCGNSISSNIYNGYWHFHGIVFDHRYGLSSSSNSGFGSTTGPHRISLERCVLQYASPGFFFGQKPDAANAEAEFRLTDCELKQGSSGAGTPPLALWSGKHRMSGITLGGTLAPVTLFGLRANTVADILIENSDLSDMAWTNLFDIPAGAQARIVVRNCKFPSGWIAYTGSIGSPATELIIDNCTDGSENYSHRRYSYAGSVLQETGIVATGGASDGTTPLSWRMSSLAVCSLFEPLYSEWVNLWVDDTTTPITPAIEVLVSGDGAGALKDSELWVECDAMVTGGTPAGTRTGDRVPQVIDAGTDQAAGTLTWSGHAYASPRTHKLTVPTFTPFVKGFIRCRVALAKPSTTIYVNPKLSLS